MGSPAAALCRVPAAGSSGSPKMSRCPAGAAERSRVLRGVKVQQFDGDTEEAKDPPGRKDSASDCCGCACSTVRGRDRDNENYSIATRVKLPSSANRRSISFPSSRDAIPSVVLLLRLEVCVLN